MALLWDSQHQGTFRVHPTLPRHVWRNLAYGRKPKGNTNPTERRAIQKEYMEKFGLQKNKSK